MITHLILCVEEIKKQIENIDYVVCKICNFHSQSLGSHLTRIHKISKKEYIDKFNSKIICEKSHQKYSKNTFRYLTNAKENNIDLTEYWGKVSAGVKKAISDNPEEKVRRAEVMAKINKSDLMKIKASEAAIKTSARPEILLQRTERLKKWRDNNPEDFHNKCVQKMINTFQSKPEKKLFEFICSIDGFDFKRNSFIKSMNFTSLTNRRQIDFFDKNKKIYIEFDGKVHFLPIFGEDVLLRNKIKDAEIDYYMKNNDGCIFIRVSYDQYVKSSFKQECLDKIVEIINNNKPGIYKIGDAYGKY